MQNLFIVKPGFNVNIFQTGLLPYMPACLIFFFFAYLKNKKVSKQNCKRIDFEVGSLKDFIDIFAIHGEY